MKNERRFIYFLLKYTEYSLVVNVTFTLRSSNGGSLVKYENICMEHTHYKRCGGEGAQHNSLVGTIHKVHLYIIMRGDGLTHTQ